jgi:hypothetical protein
MTTAREDTNRLADLLRREHHALADFLITLAAFDRERRWEELKHASLFSFLTRELHLSAGAAQYRKTAVALVQSYPEIEVALRVGRLCLSSVIALAKVITPENAAQVLPRFFGLSSRDAEFLAASIRPVERPPTRDFLVTPARATAVEVAASDAAAPSASLAFRAPETELTSVTGAVSPASSSAPPVQRERPKIKPLDAERARVNMTVSRRLLDKLAAAKDALSHSHPNASEEQILEVGLDLILQRYAKRRGLGAKPRKPAAPPKLADSASSPAVSPPSKRSRHVPAAVWRAVWERDHGHCAWPLESGEVCGSTDRIEFDHVEGFARGAATTVDGGRLLCRPHQLAAARQLYGDVVMDRYARRKGSRCSEAVGVYGRVDATPADSWITRAWTLKSSAPFDAGWSASGSGGELPARIGFEDGAGGAVKLADGGLGCGDRRDREPHRGEHVPDRRAKGGELVRRVEVHPCGDQR